jgi:glycosyltransferase involved in cell wall biosynthesis
MITIQHLIDDPGLGGVTRYLDTIEARLGVSGSQSRHIVATNFALPPALDADVVVVHFTVGFKKLPFLAALRARRGRRPIVLVEHTYTDRFEALNVPSQQRFRRMLRFAYKLADRVVAVSYGQAAWMRAAGLVSAQRLAVIPSFTDCEHLSALPLPVRADGAPLRLGAYGRYCRQKGFDTLIEAMRFVPAEIATLTLRGFGEDLTMLKALAADQPHIEVAGPIDNLKNYLTGVDAIVMPSRWEAFGQVALEARMAGRPVIARAIDGLPEQIEPHAGLLMPSDSPAELAQAIRALAQVPDFTSMGQAARDSALHHGERSLAAWRLLLTELPIQVAFASSSRQAPQMPRATHDAHLNALPGYNSRAIHSGSNTIVNR